jgi:hypothetical protein
MDITWGQFPRVSKESGGLCGAPLENWTVDFTTADRSAHNNKQIHFQNSTISQKII